MRRINLSEAPVLFVFEEVELPGFLNSLETLVHIRLLRLDDARHLAKLLILHFDFSLGLLHDFLSSLERFSQLDQMFKQLIVLFCFFPELVIEVLIQLLLVFFLLNQVLDLRVAISLQLGHETFFVRFLLRLVLFLKILISLVRCLLLFVQRLLGFLQVLARIVHLLDLNVEERVVHVHDLDLLEVLIGLENEVLQFLHGHVLLVRLVALLLQVLQLRLLVLHELCDHAVVAFISPVIQCLGHSALFEHHGLSVTLLFLALDRLRVLAGILFQAHPL